MNRVTMHPFGLGPSDITTARRECPTGLQEGFAQAGQRRGQTNAYLSKQVEIVYSLNFFHLDYGASHRVESFRTMSLQEFLFNSAINV